MPDATCLTPAIRRAFAGFPRAYSLAPLWSWNDDLREDEIARQLDQMRAQHVNEAMIFPMAGLAQPYLSPEYFDAYRFTLAAARKRGMRIWVYDDYCWPSGTAAGQLLQQYPEFRMPACRFYRYPIPAAAARRFRTPLPPGRVLHAWVENVNGSGKHQPIMDAILDTVFDWRAPAGAWTVTLAVVTQVQITLEAATGSRWARNTSGYLDVLNPAAVRKFIEMVYESHYQAAPEYFGNTMPGFFTDEPGFLYDMQIEGGRDKTRPGYHSRPGALDTSRFAGNPALQGYYRSIPWTHDLLAQFHACYGYDLRSRLPELIAGPDRAGSVCYDFCKLASDLFAENYARQIGDWCGRRRAAFSGHWTEGFGLGDLFDKAACQQAPGIDILGAHSVFNKLIMLPRQIASIARMTGRQRVLAETYGVTPWNFELADKIRDADLLTVLGVNLHAPIDYAYSFRGIRKHTNNPPGFYQSPAWRYQKLFSDHTARLCQATSLGRSAATTAILYPSHADLANSLANPAANDVLNQHLRRMFTSLMAGQIESDFLFESGLGRAAIKKGKIIFLGAEYRTVIIAGVDVLAQATFTKLTAFVKSGGRLILFDCRPEKDPYGRPAPAAWRDLLKRAAKPDRDGGVSASAGISAGRVIMASDPLSMVTHSAVLATGDKEYLFDGTDSLAVFAAHYPQDITVDLGQALPLAGLGFVVEEIKKDIVYDYSWQVSSDGKIWKDVAALKRSGREHVVRLDELAAANSHVSNLKSQISNVITSVRARFVRLLVRQGGGRFLGLHSLSIQYLDEKNGSVKTWRPPAGGQPGWRGLAGAANAAPLLFFEESGALCDCLALSVRIAGRDRIVTAMNLSGRELRLTAALGEKHSGCAVEAWDVDTGEIRAVKITPSSVTMGPERPFDKLKTSPRPGLAFKAGATFPVDFAPYECRVLAATAAPRRAPAAPSILTRRFALAAETCGPWPFVTERQNAFPLLAGSVRFADPARPERWLPAENGAIPKPLRLIPRVMFDCAFDIKTLPPGPVALLFEEDMLAEIRVNGRPLAGRPERNRYFDAFGLSLPAQKYLRRGPNRIAGLFMPEIFERTMGGIFYHADVIQPTLDAFLLGKFSVVNDRIGSPVRQLTCGPWQPQGYPYYTGAGVYALRMKLPENRAAGALWLEVAAHNGAVELCDRRGKSQAVRITPPYLFDVSSRARGGSLEFLLKITSTLGPLLTHQRMGVLTGNYVRQYSTGLESARLLRGR